MKYYIDLGSSTIKTYQSKKEIPTLIEENSIYFKEYFIEEEGVSRKNYRLLMIYMKELASKYGLNQENCKIYATGIWRNISREQYEMLRADFRELGLVFHVISQEEETFYFEKAMQGIYDSKKVLMVNMGGKTTELIVYNKGNVVTKKNLQIGVTEILNNFPTINEEGNNLKIEEVLDYALKILQKEEIDFECDCGIFTGGELRFQKLVKYNLKPNAIFHDGVHEYMISYGDFAKKNKELLEKMSLSELYLLMPRNKKWMEGAKAGAILAQAIFKKANIKYIIPSDLNIINGILKEENKF